MSRQSVICVTCPQGGTGKSTIAKEFALHVSKTTKTCLIDFDIANGGQNALFKILPTKNVVDWIKDFQIEKINKNPVELAAYYDWDKLQEYLVLPPGRKAYILPSPMERTTANIEDSDIENLLYYLKKFFDCIIIDTGNNFEDYTKSAISNANLVLMIATDDNTCLNNLQKFRHLLHINDWPRDKFHLVINRYSKNFTTYSPTDIEELLQSKSIALIPDAGDEGWMLNNAGISLLETNQDAVRKGLLQLFSAIDDIS